MSCAVKPAPRRVLYWVVRAGTIRGHGEYVLAADVYRFRFGFCPKQSNATRFGSFMACVYANAIGGRTVAVIARKGKR